MTLANLRMNTKQVEGVRRLFGQTSMQNLLSNLISQDESGNCSNRLIKAVHRCYKETPGNLTERFYVRRALSNTNHVST